MVNISGRYKKTPRDVDNNIGILNNWMSHKMHNIQEVKSVSMMYKH